MNNWLPKTGNIALVIVLATIVVTALIVSTHRAQPREEGFRLAYVEADSVFSKQRPCAMAVMAKCNTWFADNPDITNVKIILVKSQHGNIPWGAFILYEE